MDETVDVPEVSVACWGILDVSPDNMMCASSRMVVRRKGEDRPAVLACTLLWDDPQFEMGTLSDIHDEVASRYYGCGLVMPTSIKGLKVLDLGCGAGRDVYALANLVGPDGHVTGVDMTDEQLAVARQYEDWHAEKFGYDKPNTRFVQGYLETLEDLDLEPNSFDLIISNCVINLCTDKPAVFRAAHKSGALYWGDYNSIAKEAGFKDPRVVEHRPLEILDPKQEEKLGDIRFASVTARLMKLDNLDAACEDYGQAVIYKGGIEGMEDKFELDVEHHIEAGRVFPVCGNTLAMIKDTRFAPYCAAPDVFADVATKSDAAPVGGCC